MLFSWPAPLNSSTSSLSGDFCVIALLCLLFDAFIPLTHEEVTVGTGEYILLRETLFSVTLRPQLQQQPSDKSYTATDQDTDL